MNRNQGAKSLKTETDAHNWNEIFKSHQMIKKILVERPISKNRCKFMMYKSKAEEDRRNVCREKILSSGLSSVAPHGRSSVSS